MNKKSFPFLLFLMVAVFIVNGSVFAAVNGECGPLNGHSYRAPFSPSTSSELCYTGTPSGIHGSGPWTWTCYGKDGGTNAYCSAERTSVNPYICCCEPVNGQCGSSNGKYFTSAPTSNLCVSGTASAVSGSGPWTWTCYGKDGGTNAYCSANRTQPAVGQCGSANGQTFQFVPTSNLCASGTASHVSIHRDAALDNCSVSSSSLPSHDRWYWTCGTTECSADNPNDSIRSLFIASELVSYTGNPASPDRVEFWAEAFCPNSGSRFDYTVPAGYTLTSCSSAYSLGTHGGCSCCVMSDIVLTKTIPVVNGSCGFSNGGNFSSPPSSNLCTYGTASSVTTNATTYTWACAGSGGGFTAYCSANRTQSAVNGQCGSSNGGYFTSAPTSNLCVSGTASAVSGSGPWNWTCYGENNGSNAYCSANSYQQANRSPIVDAGQDKEIGAGGQSIYLYPSVFDPDGDYLTYNWSCSGGSLSSYNSLNPIFYAPNSSYHTTYTCTLTVNDGRGGIASDSVNIYIKTSYTGTLSVNTNQANSITSSSARLNGYLSNDGGENVSVRFVWGRGNNLNNYTPWIDYQRSNSYFSTDIYNLEKGKVYQFKAEAKNRFTSASGAIQKFITKPDDPYNFDANAIGTSIQLSWAMGQGACYTGITRKTNGYPVSISDGLLVYYDNGSSFVDNNVYGGVTYYYRAWSIACDEGMYSVSDSLYAKDYAFIAQPVTYTPPVNNVVVQPANLKVDIVGRNLSSNESSYPTESSWLDSVTARPGDKVEIMITVSASNGNAENVILTNALPAKIDEVYDLKIEGQTAYGDANGSFILGPIANGKSKTILFKVRLNKEDSFVYGVTDLVSTAEVNAKNVETVRDSLTIRVSKGVGEEALGGLAGFISKNWQIFYLFWDFSWDCFSLS